MPKQIRKVSFQLFNINIRDLFNSFLIEKRRVYLGTLISIAGFAGHRARVPPDPIPNSEVKPYSVSSCSVVLGHVNLGKLAALFYLFQLKTWVDMA